MENKINIEGINLIIKNTINHIQTSKSQIFQIINNLRNEHERIKLECIMVQQQISNVIEEVDKLEQVDKKMRVRLVEISKDFSEKKDHEMRAAYEEAAFIRAELISKQNEERLLRERRDTLERRIKDSLGNIESAEKIVNQVSVALGYLEGDVMNMIDEKNSDMIMGISILEAQENERRRIARDIHDGPAQHMASVIMRMDICKMLVQKDLAEGLKEIDFLKNSVKSALKEVRSILFDLKPALLEELGLNQSIEDMVKSNLESEGIEINLDLKPIGEQIEPIIQIAVYRIVQEIVNNIRKHSKAKSVSIKIDFGIKYINITIVDDGIGFDIQKILRDVKIKGTSFGLIGIIDRVKGLMGDINMFSKEDFGTSYKIKLPINREVLQNEQNKDIDSR
ncbi:MAG: sensor histidine kinase [Clostridium sp.]